jgi:hypothetical protein
MPAQPVRHSTVQAACLFTLPKASFPSPTPPPLPHPCPLAVPPCTGAITIGEWLIANGYDPAGAVSIRPADKLAPDAARPEGSGGSSGSGYAAAAAAAASLDCGYGAQEGGLPSQEWERVVQEEQTAQQYTNYTRYLQQYQRGAPAAPQYPEQQLRDWRQQAASAAQYQQQQQQQQQHSLEALPGREQGWSPVQPPLPQAASWPLAVPDAGGASAAPGGRSAVSLPGNSRLHRLPGDGSEAVAAMADFLAGLAHSPPLHLLQHATIPSVGGRPLDLRALFNAVVERGGYCQITRAGRWGEVLWSLGLQEGPHLDSAVFKEVHTAYLQLLLRFERMFDAEAWLVLTGRPVCCEGLGGRGGSWAAAKAGGSYALSCALPSLSRLIPLTHSGLLCLTQPRQSPILGMPRSKLAASGSLPLDGACAQGRSSPSASSSGGGPNSGTNTRLGVRASAPCLPTAPLERPAKRRSTDVDGSGPSLMRHSSFSGATAFNAGAAARSVTTNMGAGECATRRSAAPPTRPPRSRAPAVHLAPLLLPSLLGYRTPSRGPSLLACSYNPRPVAPTTPLSPATAGGLHFSGDSQADWGASDGLLARYRSSPALYRRGTQQHRGSKTGRASPTQHPISEPLAQPRPADHEPIGSRQGALLGGAGAPPPGAGEQPVLGQARLPSAQLLDLEWPGGGLLDDVDGKGGMDVADLLEGFSAELEGLAVENGTVVDGPLAPPGAASPPRW